MQDISGADLHSSSLDGGRGGEPLPHTSAIEELAAMFLDPGARGEAAAEVRAGGRTARALQARRKKPRSIESMDNARIYQYEEGNTELVASNCSNGNCTSKHRAS